MQMDETLYQNTLQVKQELDLILDRIDKMEQHSADVSKLVYEKVKADYSAQLYKIQSAFEAKCVEIEKSLQNLYQLRKQQEDQLQSNKEILEEAKFRHVLGEFSEDKFQEVKAQTDKEISGFEGHISHLQKQISQFEELIQLRDRLSKKSPSASVKKENEVKASTAPKEAKREAKNEVSSHTTLLQTSIPEEAPLVSPELPEADYFNRPDEDIHSSLSADVGAIEQAANLNNKIEQPAPVIKEEVAITPKSTPAPSSASSEKPIFDDSISAILKSIPLDELEEVVPPPAEVPSEAEVEKEISSEIEEFDGETGKQSLDDFNEIPDIPEEGIVANSAPRIVCVEGDVEPKEIELTETISLGRSPSNDIVLKEAKVSRQHAAINKQNDDYILIDLKSSNGVYVNGKKVEEQALKDGDQISIGSFKLQFLNS